MKRLFISLIFILASSVTLNAQQDVTRFLGIPVDGTKYDMIQKLKSKGYKSHPNDKDILTGEFNGHNVNIHIITNRDKVCRIGVADVNHVDETDIRIRFNNLCRQFENNSKYVSVSDYTIPDDEDISYEMNAKNKRYEAYYFQKLDIPPTLDSITQKEVRSFLSSKYTEEQLNDSTEELQAEIYSTTVSFLFEKYSKKFVWFIISESYGKYYITMFYDNEYNRANGEDL
jgi:hypothetical protein